MKTESVTIEQIKEQTSVENPSTYDYIIMCDGSGWKDYLPCGFGGYIYDIWSLTREEIHGGFSSGTNNYIELAPFVYALCRVCIKPGAELKICCVSDSEVTVKCGKKEYQRNINFPLWSAIANFPAQFDWKWIPRNTTSAHVDCDKIGKEIRLTLEQYERQP